MPQFPSTAEIVNFVADFHTEVTNTCNSQLGVESAIGLIIDMDPKRTHHRGGWYKTDPNLKINISIPLLFKAITQGITKEYSSFHLDKNIGSVVSDDWKLLVRAVVCHEMAHCVCSFFSKSNKNRHDDAWKGYYRILREIYINPFITHCKKGINKKVEETDRSEAENSIEQFTKKAKEKGIDPSWYGRTYVINKKEYLICGINERGRTNTLFVKRLPDGKIFLDKPILVTKRLSV